MQENFAETMRQLSAMWRGMSDQEKDRYRAAARQSTSDARPRSRSSKGSAASRARRASKVSLKHILRGIIAIYL